MASSVRVGKPVPAGEGQRNPPSPVRVAGVLAATVGTLVATRLLLPVQPFPFILPLAAIAIAALVGGAAVAMAATVVCLVTIALYAVGPVTSAEFVALLTFACAGCAIALVAGRMRARALDAERARVQSAHDLGRLNALFGSLGEGICAVDGAGKTTFANPAAERILGTPAKELVGKPFPAVEKSCASAGVGRVRCPVLPGTSGDDRGTAAVQRCRCWRLPDGGSVFALEPWVDRDADRSVRLLAETSHQLAESIDYDSTVRRIARLGARNLGNWCAVVVLDSRRRPSVVAVETGDSKRAASPPTGAIRVDVASERGLGRVLRTGEPELVRELDRAHAEVAPAEILAGVAAKSFMAVPLRARGELLGALAFVDSTHRFDDHDLSLACDFGDRCALALDNAALYRAAHDARRAREEILALVVHDLKNPVNVIRTAATALERCGNPETIRKVSELLSRSSATMTRLVEDLLDFGSIESGRLSVVRRAEDPSSIARDAVEAARPVAQERGVELVADVTGTGVVDCDRDRVLQALVNLISNAVQVSPDGGTVTVSLRQDPGSALFRVRDEGRGIPAHDQSHVFERYWRGRATTYKGTGLGLSIVKTVVELHGGRVWVESAEGKGTTFSFSLPATACDETLDVLVIDDDPDIRASMSSALELEGYRVATAANGRQAWERLHASAPPCLILLDVMMPEMNGSELLELLQADARLRAVPVVVISAFGSIAAPIAASAKGFLPKPIELDALFALTGRYCPTKSQRELQ